MEKKRKIYPHKTFTVKPGIHEKVKAIAIEKGKKLEREVEDLINKGIEIELKEKEVKS